MSGMAMVYYPARMAEHPKSMSTKSFFNLLGDTVKLYVMVVT